MQKQAKQKALKSTFIFVPLIYLINTVFIPLISGESMSGEEALKEIPIVVIAGVIYFFILYYFEKKYPKN